jgi:hypothetical protein
VFIGLAAFGAPRGGNICRAKGAPTGNLNLSLTTFA